MRKKYNFEISEIENVDDIINRDITCFSVALCFIAFGAHLPPIIIFKRETLDNGIQPQSGIIVPAHLKGLMDEN